MRWSWMMADVWYEEASPDSPLTQGELIFDCPVIGWNIEDDSISDLKKVESLKKASTAFSVNVIVMTQACDLEQKKLEKVVLCPFSTLNDFYEAFCEEMRNKGQNPTNRAWERHCKDIRDGFVWNLAMLNEQNKNEISLQPLIVDFHEIYTLPVKFLETLLVERSQQRLRLLPPYREHLSQAFARFFMRVGLPMPIGEVWHLTS